MHAGPVLSFEVTDCDRARLRVSRGAGELGLFRRPGTSEADPSIDFGLRSAPRFNIRRPYDPEGARLVTLNPVPTPTEISWQPTPKSEPAFVDWATERGLQHGLGLVGLLPSGDYFLTFSARRPHFRPQVPLGASRVDSPANVFTLLESEHLIGLAIGSESDQGPDIAAPLVGLTVLNWTGSTYIDAVLFFSLLRLPSPAEAEPSHPLLIVPVSGELVIDGLEGHGESLRKESLARWESARARQFVDLVSS
jgi:hypothetical protein